MKNLYIVGAGGFGREVAWLVRRINEQSDIWNIVGFLDDNPDKLSTYEDGYPVLAKVDFLRTIKEEAYVICAIGSAEVRKKIVKRIESYGNENIKYPILMDPSVITSSSNVFGEGSIICAGNIVTVNVNIGRHAIVNLDCTIGHEAVIGEFSTLYPSVNVSGAVTIGRCAELGTGTQIIQGVKVADNVVLGAGSVVVKDIDEKGTYVGCPVKRIK